METTAGLRLPTVPAAFAEDRPRVDFSLLTGPTEQLVRDVLEYRLDGALVNGPLRQPERAVLPGLLDRPLGRRAPAGQGPCPPSGVHRSVARRAAAARPRLLPPRDDRRPTWALRLFGDRDRTSTRIASSRLPGQHRHVRRAATATDERPRQARGDSRPAPPDHDPRAAARSRPGEVRRLPPRTPGPHRHPTSATGTPSASSRHTTTPTGPVERGTRQHHYARSPNQSPIPGASPTWTKREPSVRPGPCSRRCGHLRRCRGRRSWPGVRSSPPG
ncbi:LysR substrate-binding domain-containing protein [Streptomyces sp. NPDC054783]